MLTQVEQYVRHKPEVQLFISGGGGAASIDWLYANARNHHVRSSLSPKNPTH